MAAHQPSGSYNVSSGITGHDGVDQSVGTKKQKKNQLKVDIGNGPNKNVQNKTDRREKVSSPESEWATTTDTSIHSSPTDHEVSNNVLEACDGMDEMSLALSPSRRSSATSKGRGYKQKVQKSSKKKKLPTQGKTNQDPLSSDSSESSASDSEGESDSERSLSTGSTGTSHSSSSSDETYSSLSSSSNTRSDGHCSSNCYSDCSCSCHEDYSSSSDSATSYESTDDLTNLPRVKKGGRLGHKGTRKVENQCAQS